MRLTTFSDYAMRVLIYAAASPERLITIEETARAYDISRAHLMKVVNALTRHGFLKSVRGRSGGLSLAMPPGQIRLGAVVRATEPDFALAECFAGGSCCAIRRHCHLPAILREALGSFMTTLDRYTLADLLLAPEMLPRPPPALAEAAGTAGPGDAGVTGPPRLS